MDTRAEAAGHARAKVSMGMGDTHNGDTVGERGLESEMFIRGLGRQQVSMSHDKCTQPVVQWRDRIISPTNKCKADDGRTMTQKGR